MLQSWKKVSVSCISGFVKTKLTYADMMNYTSTELHDNIDMDVNTNDEDFSGFESAE